MKVHLSTDDIWSCPNQCGRQYRRKTGLAQHLKFECGVDLKFKCEECGKLFRHKCHMKTHLGLVHKKIVR